MHDFFSRKFTKTHAGTARALCVNFLLRLECGQLPENRQISKIAESWGVHLHVLMECNTGSLDKTKFL
jgi:hypothetical protein